MLVPIAWTVLVVEGITFLWRPFRIGKLRPPLDGFGTLVHELFHAASIALCGRILGWW